MRGSDFQNLPLTFVLGWPVVIVGSIGLLSIACAASFSLWWIISHLQWV